MPSLPLFCRRLTPRDGVYAIAQGARYRALVALSGHFSSGDVGKYLSEHGWSSVRVYEGTEPPPTDWPTAEEGGALSGALDSGHRWVRGEAVRSGPDTSIDVVSTLHKLIALRLSIYRIGALWVCEGGSRTQTGTPPASAPSSSAPPVPHTAAAPARLPRIGQGPGPAGFDEDLPPELAPSIVHAWQTEADPHALRQLAQTMRQGGYPIAMNVLDQEAMYLEAEQRAVERAIDRPKKIRGRAIAIGLAAVGVAVALVRR